MCDSCVALTMKRTPYAHELLNSNTKINAYIWRLKRRTEQTFFWFIYLRWAMHLYLIVHINLMIRHRASVGSFTTKCELYTRDAQWTAFACNGKTRKTAIATTTRPLYTMNYENGNKIFAAKNTHFHWENFHSVSTDDVHSQNAICNNRTKKVLQKPAQHTNCVKQCHKNDKIYLKWNDIYTFPLASFDRSFVRCAVWSSTQREKSTTEQYTHFKLSFLITFDRQPFCTD